MKTTLRILPFMLGIMLFFTQCEKEADLDRPVNAEAFMSLKGDDACSVTQTLWAGAGQNDTLKGTNVGQVTATLAGNILYVNYTVNVPYYLTEGHLWVGKDKLKIPRQAAPGRFPFKANLDFESEWNVEVNLTNLGIDPNNDEIFVAAHGVVIEPEGIEGLILPKDVNFRVRFFTGLTDPQAYFQTTILDGPLAGVYEGWCLDSYTRIQTNTNLVGAIYSSYDENLPELLDLQVNLPLVNWVLNYDFVGKESPGGFGTYTLGDISKALWILVEETPNPNPFGGVGPFNNDRVNEIVTLAFEEGVNFIPVCGEYLAIIVVVPGQQTTLFKFPVPCGGGSETVWAYGEHTFIELGVARKWGWIFELNCTLED